MIDLRRWVGITLIAASSAMFSLPSRASTPLSPPSPGEQMPVATVGAGRLTATAEARVFTGNFIARGQVSRGVCRWAEAWTFTTVSFDLGRKQADFAGRLVQTPLVAGCASGDHQVSDGSPLKVNGTAVSGSVTWGAYRITIAGTVSGQSLSGSFRAVPMSPWSGLDSGTFRLTSDLNISLNRASLVSVVSTGRPTGGRFSYATRAKTGSNIASIQPAVGVDATTNPNQTVLRNPPNPNPSGAPVAGGLAEITATYTKDGQAKKTFSVPTFGLSCYTNALEADWGTPPTACRPRTIYGVTHTGSVTDPPGLRGTYCASFLAEVRLQGSGLLRDGRKVQYDVAGRRTVEVQEILAADGTPVVAGRTFARDRAIIPRLVKADIDGIGPALTANDIGGAIKGYRIDLYRGAGAAVCEGFANNVAIAACQPGNAKCPARNIPD